MDVNALTVNCSGCSLTRSMGRPERRAPGSAGQQGRPGRPPAKGGRLAEWLRKHGHSREEVAKRLSIDRRHLDHIARENRRPSLELAIAIEKLTNGEVSVEYLAKIPPHSK